MPRRVTNSWGDILIYKDDADDILHCEDGPAWCNDEGDWAWYNEGRKHRVDGPAVHNVICDEWWLNGLKHRIDGPAVISSDGSRLEWWINGQRHRVGAPAHTHRFFDGSGADYWYENGLPHRLDGPASEIFNRLGYVTLAAYYIEGERYDYSTWQDYVENPWI